MHCIKSKFYLFSIAIKSTHILVGMQYTYINLDMNNTIYIFYGSIEIWFTSNKIIQLNGTIEKNINGKRCKAQDLHTYLALARLLIILAIFFTIILAIHPLTTSEDH